MRMWCLRNLRKNGKSVYLAIPRAAREELGLFVGDTMVIELDTDLKLLIVHPITVHSSLPVLRKFMPDMMPLVEDPIGDATAAAPAVHRSALNVVKP